MKLRIIATERMRTQPGTPWKITLEDGSVIFEMGGTKAPKFGDVREQPNVIAKPN